MESSQIHFDQVFKSRGGIYKTDPHLLKNSLLQDARNLIESIKNADPRAPDVYINLINNSSLNAVVTKYKEKYFIGINVGVLNLIEAMFMRMLSNPNILSNYGDTSKETAPDKIHNAQFTCFEQYLSIVGDDIKNFPIPKDTYRFRLGILLSCFVTRFLVSHEYGHILCGHVGYGDSLFESYSMHEYFNSNPPGKRLRPLISQALEMCADLYAFSVGLNNILLALKEKKQGIINDSTVFFDGLENSSKLWLFSIYTFWRLFGMYTFEANLLKEYSHPPQQIRSLFYFKWLEPQLAMKSSSIANDKVDNIIHDVIYEVEMAFSAISNQEYNLSFLSSALKQEILEHQLLVMENWNVARNLTFPFAYIDLPPALEMKNLKV